MHIKFHILHFWKRTTYNRLRRFFSFYQTHTTITCSDREAYPSRLSPQGLGACGQEGPGFCGVLSTSDSLGLTTLPLLPLHPPPRGITQAFGAGYNSGPPQKNNGFLRVPFSWTDHPPPPRMGCESLPPPAHPPRALWAAGRFWGRQKWHSAPSSAWPRAQRAPLPSRSTRAKASGGEASRRRWAEVRGRRSPGFEVETPCFSGCWWGFWWVSIRTT